MTLGFHSERIGWLPFAAAQGLGHTLSFNLIVNTSLADSVNAM